MEVNKEELRRLAEAAKELRADVESVAAYSDFKKAANPAAILSLLDENDRLLSTIIRTSVRHFSLEIKDRTDDRKLDECLSEGIAMLEAGRDQLRAENERLRAQLAESQANDRTAMGYLAEVRAIVGGDDFPGMVRNVKALRKDAERWSAAYENDVDLGMNGEEFVDWLVEKSKAPADI